MIRKKIDSWKRPLALLVALVLGLSLLPVSAYAFDQQRKGSLQITYKDGGSPMKDVGFSLYKVADINEKANFVVTEDFAPYLEYIPLKEMTASQWKEAASTLKYQMGDDVEPVRRAETDGEGIVLFQELELGLYLVVGEYVKSGRYGYTPAPFLVSIPSVEKLNDGSASWVYDIAVDAKFSKEPSGGGGGGKDDTVSRKVIKEWKDNGHRQERPNKIQVELLRNGKVYDTVTLDAENDWRFTWNSLDDDYEWTIREKVVAEHYTVEVSAQGRTFVVTNTFDGEGGNEDPDEDPKDSEEEEWEFIEDEDPPLAGIEEEPPLEDEEILPATGVLWWPVPVLGVGGMLMLLIGWFLKRSEEDED